MLDIDQLTHRYGSRVVLNSVSAQLPANGISMLVGDNGAGKTTLLRIILGILRPTAGSVRWHGQPIRLSGVRHSGVPSPADRIAERADSGSGL